MLGFGLLLLAISLFLVRRYYLALLLFFGFVTNGYQIVSPGLLMAGAPTDKLTDSVLILLLIALVTRNRVLWQIRCSGRSFSKLHKQLNRHRCHLSCTLQLIHNI